MFGGVVVSMYAIDNDKAADLDFHALWQFGGWMQSIPLICQIVYTSWLGWSTCFLLETYMASGEVGDTDDFRPSAVQAVALSVVHAQQAHSLSGYVATHLRRHRQRVG